jgi:uncharacterized membrane protein YphA (DoxX/SURF4 family)
MQTVMQFAPEIVLLLFLAIVFIQSALDKILDWKGNLSWLTGHFSKTLFRGIVPFLLAVILVSELAAGIFSFGGVLEVLFTNRTGKMAIWGGVLSCVSLLMLLAGQRLAKDYDGARTLVIYLMPAVFLLYLLEN